MTAAPRRPVLLAWQAASNFGWGVAGLSLFNHWAGSPRIHPLMAFPMGDLHVPMQDAARMDQLCTAVLQSNDFAAKLAQAARPVRAEMPVVHALGNGFEGDFGVTGAYNIARTVFEDTRIEDKRAALEKHQAVVCASEWNASVLRSFCDKPVHVIHEAVDQALFHPGPKSGLFSPDRFHIFTGGKIEFRKAQDLVLLAFGEFSRRHDDAVLVTAWHSPWPAVAAGFQGRLPAALHMTGDRLDVLRWVADNGVRADRVIDLGPVLRQELPRLLREMDCALQPSRAEGGTNFVAMEAMSCGVPVIVPANTGTADLIAGDSCVPLISQGPVESPEGWGTAGWGESEVEEILEALERLYVSSALRRRVGAAGAAFMASRTWPDHADALEKVIFPDG